MAGTDRSKLKRGLPQGVGKSSAPEMAGPGGPAVILVEPQLGLNIGMTARAMLNCGLLELRLVNPRDGWPHPDAPPAASGADVVLDQAKLYDTTAEAVADLNVVFAATARERDMTKRVVTPRAAVHDLKARGRSGSKAGILFGKESKGLTNDDLALADAILQVPLNPAFSSLNLAQAVLIFGYEWYQAHEEGAEDELVMPKETRPAERAELIGLFEHLERELDACGFLRPPEKRPAMVRSIRNMLGRADMTEQEVRTFRGIIAGLTRPRGKARD